MVVTNDGKSGLCLAFIGSMVIPRYCGIGSGSGTVTVNDSSLVAEVGSRVDFTTRDASIVKQVEWTFDFGAKTMSGINLREFGLFDNQANGSGTMWCREGFDTITFDGTNELQIQITFEVF